VVKLYGRIVSKNDLTRRVGQISQIAGARACELSSGLARGVEAIDVKTGTGFEFTVLAGRALDIAWASYKGAPIGYIAKSGVVGPAHFVENGAEGFLRNFFAGLLTTAGLRNIGPPVQDGDESLGLHGRVSNIPAEDVCVSQGWQGDDYKIRLAGTVRQARTFGECLVLHREITTQLGSNALVVRDVVENAGFRPEPMMLLYHCNFGYPLVSADSRIFTSGGSVEPRGERGEACVQRAAQSRFELVETLAVLQQPRAGVRLLQSVQQRIQARRLGLEGSTCGRGKARRELREPMPPDGGVGCDQLRGG